MRRKEKGNGEPGLDDRRDLRGIGVMRVQEMRALRLRFDPGDQRFRKRRDFGFQIFLGEISGCRCREPYDLCLRINPFALASVDFTQIALEAPGCDDVLCETLLRGAGGDQFKEILDVSAGVRGHAILYILGAKAAL